MTYVLLANGWTNPSVWLVLAAIILIWFSLSRAYRRRPAPRDQESEFDNPEERLRSSSLGRALSSSLEQWEVRMHELTRELEGRINSKLGLLEQLIQEADRAAARLESALRTAESIRKTQAAGMLPASAHPAIEINPPAGTAEKDQTAGNVNPDISQPQVTQANLQDGITAEAPASVSSSPSTGELPDKGHPRRSVEEIYTLADYGYSPEEIAQRTGTPIGEVQLILSLRKSRNSAEAN